jgi:hypothetical protein
MPTPRAREWFAVEQARCAREEGKVHWMTTGSGIAAAGWLLAFVWACSVSENTAAGVVFAGICIVFLVGAKRFG